MMKFRFPLHIHLSTLFVLMTLIVSGAIATIGYRMSYNMLEASAEDLTQRASREIVGELRAQIGPADTTVEIFSAGSLPRATSLAERMAEVRAMAVPLQNSTGISNLYIGYDNGDFFMLQRLDNDAMRNQFEAPPGSHFLVRSIEHAGGMPRGRMIYLDENLEHVAEREQPDYARSYDPRTRDWYRQAQQTLETITTAPYMFYTLRKVGVTVGRRAGNGQAVIAADITLDALGEVLARQKITPSSQLALVRADGKVIGHERLDRLLAIPGSVDAKPELRHLDSFGIMPMQGLSGEMREALEKGRVSRLIRQDDTKWQTTVTPLALAGADPVYLVTAIPEHELFEVALRIRDASITSIIGILLIALPLIWLVAHTFSRSMRQLTREAEAIRHFEFDAPIKVNSVISEVYWLAETMDLMKRSIRKFMNITHAVAAEPDFEALLSMLLKDTMNVSNAAAGALYLAEEDALVPSIAYAADGSEVSSLLRRLALDILPQLIREAVDQRTALAGHMSEEERERFALAPIEGDGATYTVVAPLLNRQHHLLGLMLLQRQTPINGAQLAFAGALTDSASSSLETRGLIRDQKALFEAFIKLIAGAIDAKSPYTGGHCARVPELTKMLAHAACSAVTGPYSDFKLSAEEWEAVHVAAWLHDCGKVTTPEYVVDKATKLETLHDRIHEIRMRFEVLKRDAEIHCLKSISAGTPEAEARARMEVEWRKLDDDFAFIAECNLGGELMVPERLERLEAIAARTWLRTLDDRIGISHEEKARKEEQPAAPLPVVEPLLADKPEHRIVRREGERIAPDNPWGFQMQVPELLYNRGEVYNLAVGRGTLSEEERYKINEHIVQTIIMLSALPFPRHLKNVPEIAGGHHEKMDGTGYPKRLHQDQMSPLARMMAIADIFEALTARDRPYKQGKTLSEAIRIMSFMKKDQHIDPELFDLFLRSGVYLEYAYRHMTPEQIDAVDIEPYLTTH